MQSVSMSSSSSSSENVKRPAKFTSTEEAEKEKILIARNARNDVHRVTFDVIGIGFDEQVNRSVKSDTCL